VLTSRSQIAGKKKQRELGYDTHVAAAGKANAQLALSGTCELESCVSE
jgi:hypothetical protein